MKTKLLIISVMLGMVFSGCSRKAAPTISPAPYRPAPVYVHSDCDSLIQEVLNDLANIETECPEDNKLAAVVVELNDAKKALLICSTQLAAVPAITTQQPCPPTRIRIKNSYNEETKLKNSMQIKDATIDGLTLENVALRGKLKQSNDSISKLVAKKGGVIGDGNTVDNSKKGVGWFWIFVAGNLCWMVVQNVGFPMLKGMNPFAGVLSKARKVFKGLIS